MVGFLLAALCLVSLSGCAGVDAFRPQRDAWLTRCEEPVSLAFAAEAPPSAIADPSAALLPLTLDRSMNYPAAIRLDEALWTALQSSPIVRVSEGSAVFASRSTFYDLQVSEERIRAALSAFDTSFEARLYSSRIKQPPDAFFGPGLSQPSLRDEGAFNAGFVKPLVTGGKAQLFYNPDPGYLFIPNPTNGDFNPRHVGNLELSVVQPLLRGAGLAVNRAPIQISQISASQSAWDFKKAAMASVRSVVETYWELHAAYAALQSLDEVLPLLEEVVRIQEEAYQSEWVIYADVAKAYAQLYDYRQQRVALESEIMARELRLRHLMGAPPSDGWTLKPVTPPTDAWFASSASVALEQALSHRPELVRQRLQIKLTELELLVARNQLKPSLDLRALYRMNGVGEDLGSAIEQLSTAEFADWELGATFSVPLGRRQATAEANAAELRKVRESHLLQQMTLSVAHQLGDRLRRIDFAYRGYREAENRARAASQWVEGARLRFQNPNQDAGEGNWLLQSLNDYLDALRFRTDAATDASELLARYNVEIAQLEEDKGTILAFFGIDFPLDPCRQSRHLDAAVEPQVTPLVYPVTPFPALAETVDAPRGLQRLPDDRTLPVEAAGEGR